MANATKAPVKQPHRRPYPNGMIPVIKRQFLAAFAKTGIVGDGVKAAGTSYRTVRQWLEEDEEFKQAYEDAFEESTDRIEHAVIRRGVDGVTRKKHTFYKGNLVHTYRYKEYSDNLLLAAVKRRIPEYRDRSEVTHSGDVRFLIQFEGDETPSGEIVDGQYRALT